MDYGHKLTDEELKELEKRINAEYTQAEKEVAQKLSNYLAGFMRRDIEQKTLVDAGEISEREYLNWRAGQIATGKRWEELRQSLAEDMHRTNVETQKQAQSESMDIYALNHNYGTYEVENGAEIDTKYTLYDRQTVERLVKDNPQMLPPPGKKVSERIKAGLDVRWNNQHIQSVMMQSLLQGESIGKIATRLANAVGDSNRAAAIRNARTMTTGAENAGRVDAYERAKDMGVPVRQMWVATIDDRTRESHRKMDGETIEPGETFSNKCRFPGDPLGEPSEVYNCRCTLVARIPGVQYTFAERGTDKDSYEEWKKGKETEEKPQVEEQKTEEPKVEEVEKPKDEIVEDVVEDVKDEGLKDGVPNSATEYYVSGDGMWINQYLRGNGDFGELTENEEQFLHDLDVATNGKVEIDTLYRSVDAKAIFGNISDSDYSNLVDYVIYGDKAYSKGAYSQGLKEKAENLVSRTEGKEITEKGFMSTTKSEEIATNFGDFTGAEHPMVMKIDTGGYVKGVDVSLYDQNVSEGMEQQEVLLAREQDYIVERIYALETDDGKFLCADVKLINDDEQEPQVEDVKDETKATGFEFVPASSIADAEEYAKSFVDDSQFGAIGISYKGIGLDVANEVNKTIGDFYNTYNVSQFGGVYAPKGNTKLGKMMQDAHAAYSPVRNSFLINYDCKTLEYVERQLAEEKALVKDFLANPDKYDKSNMSQRALKVLENSITSGRGTVPDNMEDIVNHELGHCLERFIKQADNYDDIMANMEEFAPKISGYAVDNFNEYIAESFCSYKKGEEIVDPELIKAFKELERK